MSCTLREMVSTTRPCLCWTCPTPCSIKCSVDGAIFADRSQVGIGWVMRDFRGQLLHACSKVYSRCFAAVEVEALALRDALQWVLHHQLHHVIFELDCKPVVDASRTHHVDLSEFGCLIVDYKYLLSLGLNFTLRSIRSQANLMVHSLTRTTGSNLSPLWHEASNFLVDALAVDVFAK